MEKEIESREENKEETVGKNFIEQIIEKDLAEEASAHSFLHRLQGHKACSCHTYASKNHRTAVYQSCILHYLLVFG